VKASSVCVEVYDAVGKRGTLRKVRSAMRFYKEREKGGEGKGKGKGREGTA
jgi:hypothetical protein